MNINDNLSQIRSERGSFSSSNLGNTNYSNRIPGGSSENVGGYSSMNNLNLNQNIQRSINEKINILNNIENKFSKIKILSYSNNSRSAIKHYRNASSSNISANNSTSNTSNALNNNNNVNSNANNNNYAYNNMYHRKSGSSSANFNY